MGPGREQPSYRYNNQSSGEDWLLNIESQLYCVDNQDGIKIRFPPTYATPQIISPSGVCNAIPEAWLQQTYLIDKEELPFPCYESPLAKLPATLENFMYTFGTGTTSKNEAVDFLCGNPVKLPNFFLYVYAVFKIEDPCADNIDVGISSKPYRYNLLVSGIREPSRLSDEEEEKQRPTVKQTCNKEQYNLFGDPPWPPAGKSLAQTESKAMTKTTGPGTQLAKTLASWGFKEGKGCSCKKMSRLMDGWGSACATDPHLTTIVDHLAKEAKKRKLPFVRKLAEALIKRAVRQSENQS